MSDAPVGPMPTETEKALRRLTRSIMGEVYDLARLKAQIADVQSRADALEANRRPTKRVLRLVSPPDGTD